MQQCASTTTENVIISPFSVFDALSLLEEGANGKTFQELAAGLGTGSDKNAIATQFKNYYDLLYKAVGSSSFSLANALYLQVGYELNPEYQNLAVNQFMSTVKLLDFADAAGSAATINEFVEENTDDKIQNLISPDMLGADTRLVLVNAIYFKVTFFYLFNHENIFFYL